MREIDFTLVTAAATRVRCLRHEGAILRRVSCLSPEGARCESLGRSPRNLPEEEHRKAPQGRATPCGSAPLRGFGRPALRVFLGLRPRLSQRAPAGLKHARRGLRFTADAPAPVFRVRVIALVAAVTLGTALGAEPPMDAPTSKILWTTGKALMPGWGLYPNGSEYCDSKPLAGSAAWTPGNHDGWLTWVADVPADGVYEVFVRRYAGYGQVEVQIDEQEVSGGRGLLEERHSRYLWFHIGQAKLSQGDHHVDIVVRHTMFDAIALSSATGFNPAQAPLPCPVERPRRAAPRTYRDDAPLAAHAGASGFVVGRVVPYAVDPRQQPLGDYLPTADRLLDQLKLWGSRSQYARATFALRALEDLGDFRVALDELTGPDGTRLDGEKIDLRVVHLRPRTIALFEGEPRSDLCPDLLLRDDRTPLPPRGDQGGFGGTLCTTHVKAHESKQFWLTVHVPPKTPAGTYRGTLEFRSESLPERKRSLPVELEVFAIDLAPVEGYYSIYYPSQPVDPKRPNYVAPERYVAELQDQVRHGLNAATLYGGFATLKYAKEAGMTQPPVLMHWPDGDARQQVRAAQAMGFPDLYYYGVDEPRGPAVERCRKEAERRTALGLHMFTAINGLEAWKATRDFIDRPVYCIHVFSGPKTEAAAYARGLGHVPVSYWVTSVSYPLHHRVLAGLYNTACGYQGTAPWAYQDFPDDRLYGSEGHVHAVAYPDASGRPIPSLRWEALRDGIDDVRYLQALRRAMDAAENRLQEPNPSARLRLALSQARTVEEILLKNLDGRWFQNLCAASPEWLEELRREMARRVVEIQEELR